MAVPGPSSRVAPIFVHGEGRGAYGCVVVSPPFFLSEEDARQVIVEEAARFGLFLSGRGETLPDVAVPVTDPHLWERWLPDGEEGCLPPQTRIASLTADGSDEERAVSYHFVSRADHDAWETEQQGPYSSVAIYETRGAAEALRAGLETAQPAHVHAVFYDPIRKFDRAVPDTRRPGLIEALPELIEALRERVLAALAGIGLIRWQYYAQRTLRSSMPRIPTAEEVAARQAAREAQERANEDVRERAREDVREQVRDFVDWLRLQGVL